MITREQVESALNELEHRWYLNEDHSGDIHVSQSDCDTLLYCAENTIYCRDHIAYLANEVYSYLLFQYPQSRSTNWHRNIQKTLLDTGLNFYMLSWEEWLVRYAIDVAELDVNHYVIPLNEYLLRHLPFLLTRGLNVDLQDEKGNTLLHHIVLNHRHFYELFDLLLPHQPELMLANHKGETPLDIAKPYRSDVHAFLLTMI